jgi:hypothetical protein
MSATVRCQVHFDADLLVGVSNDDVVEFFRTTVANVASRGFLSARDAAARLPDLRALFTGGDSDSAILRSNAVALGQSGGGSSGSGGKDTSVNVGVSFPIGSNGSSVDVSVGGSAGSGGGKLTSVEIKVILK